MSRARKYAAAMHEVECGCVLDHCIDDGLRMAEACLPVADAEQAELRAEVERLRERAEDFEGRYEVAHEARMLAERLGDALRAQVDQMGETMAALRNDVRALQSNADGWAMRARVAEGPS